MHLIARVAVIALLASPPALGLAVGCGGSGDNGSGAGPGTGSTGTQTTGAGGSTSGTASTTGTGGGAGGGSTSTGTSGTAGTGGGTGAGGATIASCQGHIYECGDTLDNDNDGLVDSADPDCLGPCDNTEGSYYGGIPGQAGPACTVDCYFDQDSGSGNDDCYWNHQCDPNEVAPGYHPEAESGATCAYDTGANTPGTPSSCDELYQTQSQACMDYCGPLTPNGCDCFGCCELPAGGGKYVWLGSETNGLGTCTIADVGDPSKCEPCLPVAACLNTCGTCELCIGKTELPPECFPDGGSTSSSGGGGGSTTSSTSSGSGGGGSQCADGVQPCGLPGQGPCPLNYYCITGCCIKQPN